MEIHSDVMHTDRCASAFDRIGWAFLFFLDIEIAQFDILPDFIGWAIIAHALHQILELAYEVRGLRNLALGLIFFSLLDFFDISIFFLWNWQTLLDISAAVLGLILVWKLCALIIAMAQSVDYSTLARTAEDRQGLYLGSEIGLLLLGLFVAFMAVHLFSVIFFVAALAIKVIIIFLMFGLMRDTETMCRNNWTV